MMQIFPLWLISLIIRSFLFSLDREDKHRIAHENERNRTYFEEAIACMKEDLTAMKK